MLPPWLHITIVVVLTLYFLFRLIKDHYFYEFLFILWLPSTLLTYLSEDKTFLTYLGIGQLVLFFLVIFFMFRKRGERRHKTLSLLAQMAADGMPESTQTEEADSSGSNDDDNSLK